MRVLAIKVFLLLPLLLVPTVAAAFAVYIADVCSEIAKVFFLVAPLVFVVGSAVGLVSRHRA